LEFVNMPNPAEYEDQAEWMKVCVPKIVGEGKDNEQAVAICTSMWADKEDAAKFRLLNASVKAIGDWELDILAVPFDYRDADKQWFDDKTDIMEQAFSTPLMVYQHGIQQGARRLDDKPIIVGKTKPGSLTKKSDGWHIRVVLDKALKVAKDIMEAAYKNMVAVSSGSISHLARLDIGGKLIQYEKNRAGRIAVWPLAEVSIWEMGGGNVQPANPFAIAMPVMKAMYREAGVRFPDVDTIDAVKADEVRRRAKVEEIKQETLKLIAKMEKSK
jgi:hypothetical protein